MQPRVWKENLLMVPCLLGGKTSPKLEGRSGQQTQIARGFAERIFLPFDP